MTSCVPFTPDLACCDSTEWNAYDPALRERAIDLAWASLRHLTGGQVGNCPIGVRPCRKGCATGANVPPWTPMLRGGAWYNLPCGGGCKTSCSCGNVSEVVLPGPVAKVERVLIDGAELDPSAYRIDNGHILVRQDGDEWPQCQDLSVAWDQPGAFTVVYVPGRDPGPSGLWAAGVLACEFAKACSGAKCRLPSSVTSLSRQGVSMEFSQGFFAGGMTGIREVDAFVMSVNPAHLHGPPKVWSPDLSSSKHRYTPVATVAPTPLGPFGPEFDAADFAVMAP